MDSDRAGADDAETDADRVDDAPLSDLVREVRERRRGGPRRTDSAERDGALGDEGGALGGDDADANRDDPFKSAETPAVDAESLWETPAAGGDAVDPAATRGAGVGSDPGSGEASAEGDGEHVVPKRTYCQQCPHFSAPPAVACGREGTTVVEVVDADHFRVRNCPVARDAAESDADADAR